MLKEAMVLLIAASGASQTPTVDDFLAMSEQQRAAYLDGYFQALDAWYAGPPCAADWFYSGAGKARIATGLKAIAQTPKKSPPDAFPYRDQPMALFLRMMTAGACLSHSPKQ
jgi:hypothetical protein